MPSTSRKAAPTMQHAPACAHLIQNAMLAPLRHWPNNTQMTDPARFPHLAHIDSPADLRRIPDAELPAVAEELRQYLIESVATSGGHFGAGLGVVELTVALHAAFNTPTDRLVWDVGHQSYPHKILTGRREQITTVKKQGGLAPFPRRSESDYDTFGVGHSSTSISAALGMAIAAQRNGGARGLNRCEPFAEQPDRQDRDQDRCKRIKQPDVHGRTGFGADVDERAADPHAERAKQQRFLPLATPARPGATQRRQCHRQHDQKGDGPAGQRQLVGRDDTHGCARDDVVRAPEQWGHEQEDLRPAQAGFGGHRRDRDRGHCTSTTGSARRHR